MGINNFNGPKAFIEYSNDMHDVYKYIDEYNPDKENKILIVFDVTELFIRGRKLNISLVFISQSYLKVPKDVRLNTSHFSHSSDISTKDFQNIYRNCTDEPYYFLVIDTMPASNNPLGFRKNLFNIECNSLGCNSII